MRTRFRRLFFAEHWKVGTIAAERGVHHDTVRGAIEAERFIRPGAVLRASMLDAYKPFVAETLVQHPRLRATRLFEMIRAGGRSAPDRQVQISALPRERQRTGLALSAMG